MKKFFLALLLPAFLFGQYSKNDEALIKTTYLKSYDKKLISSYLGSSNSRKVKAALLSLSSSEDTNFVQKIITAGFEKNGGYIAFALGQLGPCYSSAQYLSKIIFSNNFKFRKECLEAFSKTAELSQLEQLIEFYNLHKEQNWDGISLGLLNFFNRNIKTTELSKKSFEILQNEFSSPKNSEQRRADALFAFYRMGGNPDYKDLLVKLLSEEKKLTVNIKQHLLASLRRISYFPADFGLYKLLLNDKNTVIKIEAAKLLTFYNHTKSDELNSYLTLLTDSNPNVSRQAATSLQSIKMSAELKPVLKNSLTVLIKNPRLPENTKGEIFKTYIKLFPEELKQFFENNKNTIRKDFIYETAGNNYKELSLSEDYFYENYKKENLKNRLGLANIILGFPLSGNNDKLIGFILEELKSSSPAITATFAEGIPDTLVMLKSQLLIPVIEKQIKEKLNEPDFYEGTISLANLAKKISAEFYNSMLNLLNSSKVYSVKKYAAAASGKKEQISKNPELFSPIFENSFKYKEAVIKTVKGEIKIKFLPDIAPVSVGNFCYLAANGFYNNNMFHRVVPGFVIQAGDPTETGFGGPGHEIITEPSLEQYKTGALGMASAGKDTEGSQWFIMQGYHPHLNGRYSLFAKVIKGMETVLMIDQDEKVVSIELIK